MVAVKTKMISIINYPLHCICMESDFGWVYSEWRLIFISTPIIS